MTLDADTTAWSSGRRSHTGTPGVASRNEIVVRVVLGVGVAFLAVPITLYVFLGLTMDLHLCLDRPDQLACGDFSQDLVGGLCLAAGAVLAVGGLGLAVVSRTAGRWWWPALAGVVAAYGVLLGIAIAVVAP